MLSGIGVLLPPEAANAVQLTLDPSVVLFTVAMSVLTGLLFGIVPALQSTRVDLISTLKDQAGQVAGARVAARFRNGLVTAQFALSTTLLVAAGLFIQSLNNVTRLDLGILPEDVTTFRLAPGLSGYADEQQRQALYERVEAELAALPGVTDVSVAFVPVFIAAGHGLGISVMVEGFEAGRTRTAAPAGTRSALATTAPWGSRCWRDGSSPSRTSSSSGTGNLTTRKCRRSSSSTKRSPASSISAVIRLASGWLGEVPAALAY